MLETKKLHVHISRDLSRSLRAETRDYRNIPRVQSAIRPTMSLILKWGYIDSCNSAITLNDITIEIDERIARYEHYIYSVNYVHKKAHCAYNSRSATSYLTLPDRCIFKNPRIYHRSGMGTDPGMFSAQTQAVIANMAV